MTALKSRIKKLERFRHGIDDEPVEFLPDTFPGVFVTPRELRDLLRNINGSTLGVALGASEEGELPPL